MLKFIIDHNVPKTVSSFLNKKGYDVKLVREIDAEMTDLQIVKFAVSEHRIILSNDKDFISLALKYNKSDMIIFDFLSQKSEIRIDGLKQILDKITPPFGVIVLQ